MIYSLEVSEMAKEAFKKLRKDKAQRMAVEKKVEQIVQNPEHFKPLRGPMTGVRRAHVGSFVITFEIDYSREVVRLLDYDHHDKIYK